MKLLSTSLYSIAIEAIKSIDINHLFALAVAEQKPNGYRLIRLPGTKNWQNFLSTTPSRRKM